MEASRHVICKNSVLNSIVLREYNLGVIVLISLLSSYCQSAIVVFM
jgi:hypothetical protein